jgi:Protein of unknown function (DUF4197)
MTKSIDRRTMMAGAAATALILPMGPLLAAGGIAPLNTLLGNASDSALDKLAKPGAFYADKAVRILLPGGKTISKIFALGSKAGLTDGLVKSINEAAGLAAGEAKPIFRSAIGNLSLSDVPGIAKQKDGGTQYLRTSAGGDLRSKIEPLVDGALNKVGAFGKLEKLSKAGGILSKFGLDRAGLTKSVSDQAMAGIFSYLGNEEAAFRANPLKSGKSILDGLGL